MNNLNLITTAVGYIEEHLAEPVGLDAVARAAHYSKYHLHRAFAAAVGITLHSYAQRRRLTEAARLLVFTRRPILDIALGAGYQSQQAFTKVFREMYKQSPRQFRESEEYYALQLKFEFHRPPDQHLPATITYATAEDIPDWMELARLAVDGLPRLREEQHRAALTRLIGERGALVMRRGPAAVGIMALCRATGSIELLSVHPLCRGRGVTQALLNRALTELAPRQSISTTTFRAGDSADTGHRRTLQGLGFSQAELLWELGYPTQRMVLDAQEVPR